MPTLGKDLRDGIELLDFGAGAGRHQAVPDRQQNLGANFEFTVHQDVIGVRNRAFGRVFNRHHTVIRPALRHVGKHVGDARHWLIPDTGAKLPHRCHVRVRRGGPEERDDQRFFQRQRARHDFPINGA